MATKVYEGKLYYRKDPKDKWEKVYGQLEHDNGSYVLRLVQSKEEPTKTIQTFKLSKGTPAFGFPC